MRVQCKFVADKFNGSTGTDNSSMTHALQQKED